MEFIPEGVTVNRHLCTLQFIVSSFDTGRNGCCYITAPLHIALCLSKRGWQNNRLLFATPSILTQSCIMQFIFLSHLKEKLRMHRFQSAEETFLQISFNIISNSYVNVGILA
jgi:hypothetical protein